LHLVGCFIWTLYLQCVYFVIFFISIKNCLKLDEAAFLGGFMHSREDHHLIKRSWKPQNLQSTHNCIAMPLYFHVVPSTTEAFMVRWDELFCALLISVRILCQNC
jgi:hypothetical protein